VAIVAVVVAWLTAMALGCKTATWVLSEALVSVSWGDAEPMRAAAAVGLAVVAGAGEGEVPLARKCSTASNGGLSGAGLAKYFKKRNSDIWLVSSQNKKGN
jgi:hypothetical protein